MLSQTKAPIADWSGKTVLWLGTSIPHQGGGVDSYPTLFGAGLGCTVTNNAWSGSHAYWSALDDPFSIVTVRALSMTEDDRLALLAIHGPTSAYDDSFDVSTKASEMTADFRIKAAFAAGTVDCVILDHAHNDVTRLAGVLNPTAISIVSITKGATTSITLSAGGSTPAGSAVILNVVGIAKLHQAAARVISAVGATITLNINSSGYAGSFVSGSVTPCDRSTIYGSFQFLVNYIHNAAAVNARPVPKIVLASPPSAYSGGTLTPSIRWISALVRTVADKLGCSFFDILTSYAVTEIDQPTWFPDLTHPTTVSTRQAIANHWIQWGMGGAPTL